VNPATLLHWNSSAGTAKCERDDGEQNYGWSKCHPYIVDRKYAKVVRVFDVSTAKVTFTFASYGVESATRFL
jgi:hypothetical protein